MTDNDLVYALHWLCVALMLAIGWMRGRSILHPLFVMAAVFSVMLSDFLTRGYADKNIENIPIANVHAYQMSILGTFLAIIVLGAAIRTERTEAAVRRAWTQLDLLPAAMVAVEVTAWAVLGTEVAKRLYSVGFDPLAVVTQMLNARGDRVWDQEHYGGNFVYAIINIVQPFAAFAFAYLVINASGARQLRAALGYLIVLAILITDGSRTQAAIALAAIGMFVLLRPGRLALKLASIGAVAAIGAVAMSYMFLYRSTGILADAVTDREFAVTYHQDDSYYRAVFAHHIADRGDKPWDAGYFVYANVANPIPRALWPEKPILDEAYWGDYKLFYVTNLFVGEIVAMAGTAWTPLWSIMLGLMIYGLLYHAGVLLAIPFGAAAYVLVALYAYMIVRSAMNVSHFMYLPLFGVVVVLFLHRLQTRARRQDVPGEET